MHDIGPKKATKKDHEQSGSYPLVADIGKNDGKFILLFQGKGIVKITGNLTGGLKIGKNLPAGYLWHGLWKKTGLDPPAYLQLSLCNITRLLYRAMEAGVVNHTGNLANYEWEEYR